MHLMHIEISAVASTDLQVPVSPGLPTLAQQSVKPSLATSEDTAVLGGSQLFSRLKVVELEEKALSFNWFLKLFTGPVFN